MEFKWSAWCSPNNPLHPAGFYAPWTLSNKCHATALMCTRVCSVLFVPGWSVLKRAPELIRKPRPWSLTQARILLSVNFRIVLHRNQIGCVAVADTSLLRSVLISKASLSSSYEVVEGVKLSLWVLRSSSYNKYRETSAFLCRNRSMSHLIRYPFSSSGQHQKL